MSTTPPSIFFEKLHKHYQEKGNSLDITNEFKTNPHRFEQLSEMFIGSNGDKVFFDFSKNLITTKTLDLLIGLCQESGVKEQIERMWSGDKINFTEGRSVLHVALRNKAGPTILQESADTRPLVDGELASMKRFSDSIRSGEWKGYTGKKITRIVNIGIGGSSLGPLMACKALQPYSNQTIEMNFVSNIDGTDLSRVLKISDPETTLFIVVSKTFTTLETMTNAGSAREWFISKTEPTNLKHHFVAVSTNIPAVSEFGINTDVGVFRFWDWVGGRFSLWSTVGLSICCSIGMDNFQALLQGAYEVDRHFTTTEIHHNIPILMALLNVWYSTFCRFSTQAIIPYDDNLSEFTGFLQQMVMESNGKSIDINGNRVDYPTSPVVWGTTGTNGQHAYFQLIHQGTSIIPCDFIILANSHHPIQANLHHQMLVANAIAQTEALMVGKPVSVVQKEMKGKDPQVIKQVGPHRSFEGRRPSTTIVANKLTPFVLGALIAFYEHRTFVEGVIWKINSFDQFGVELGKTLALNVLSDLQNDTRKEHDSSTNGLIDLVKKWTENKN